MVAKLLTCRIESFTFSLNTTIGNGCSKLSTKLRTHPVPQLKAGEMITGFDDKGNAKILEEMSITHLKNLLMVDEERRFQMGDTDDDVEIENCGFVPVSSANETVLVLLENRSMDKFDTMSFEILCDDVSFN